MQKIIKVIQLGTKPIDYLKRGICGDFSTVTETLFVREAEYSQGELSWSSTHDPLKALDLNKHPQFLDNFISTKEHKCRLEGTGTILKTFNVTVEECS